MNGARKSRFWGDASALLVLFAPTWVPLQVYVPTPMRYGVRTRENYPPHARNPCANKTHMSMRPWLSRESMAVDVYAFMANFVQCARNRVGKRRMTANLNTFPATETLTN